MREIAFEVDDVHVTYRSVKAASIKKLLGRPVGSRVVNAVNGVSFSVEQGEILGIIGQNGGGKSTLLRTIAGIFAPDSGSIDLHGHSCSLLAIGIGFIPELSGRDNIMLSGLLMGFTMDEVKAREPEIVSYSELGDSIDNPVRTYSSGMYSRLAFAITVMLRTDILLVDEVLSVGDERFKAKSRQTMKSIMEDASRTVVIVSHDIDRLEKMCTRAMWMDKGLMVASGDPHEVISAYTSAGC